MSGFITAVVVSAAAVAGASIYSANKQAKAQREAADEQKRMQEAQLRQREMDFKRQNANDADVSGLLEKNRPDGDVSSNLLTGAQGIDPNKLKLGATSLLGG